MNKITINLFLLLVLSFNVYSFENNIKLADPEQSKLLLTALKENNIPHRIDDQQKIYYDSKYRNKVSKLVRETVSNDIPSGTSLSYGSKSDHEYFISLLKKENIHYVIKHRHGQNWVIWNQSDSRKIEEIKKQVSAHARKVFEDSLKK